jgi:hypothetical protein
MAPNTIELTVELQFPQGVINDSFSLQRPFIPTPTPAPTATVPPTATPIPPSPTPTVTPTVTPTPIPELEPVTPPPLPPWLLPVAGGGLLLALVGFALYYVWMVYFQGPHLDHRLTTANGDILQDDIKGVRPQDVSVFAGNSIADFQLIPRPFGATMKIKDINNANAVEVDGVSYTVGDEVQLDGARTEINFEGQRFYLHDMNVQATDSFLQTDLNPDSYYDDYDEFDNF